MQKAARIQIFLAALFAFTSVLLGALGAHALEDALAEQGKAAVWETAALYHLAHALALFALGIWSAGGAPSRGRSWAAGCWTGGIILFSGSLYVLALGGPPRVFGPVTPLGGLLFLGGWIAVSGAAWREK